MNDGFKAALKTAKKPTLRQAYIDFLPIQSTAARNNSFALFVGGQVLVHGPKLHENAVILIFAR